MSTIGERLDALKEPSPKVTGYGDHECGCTWDSGPFGVFCDQHDAEALERDALVQLHDAARVALDNASHDNLSRLRAIVEDVGRVLAEGTEPAT